MPEDGTSTRTEQARHDGKPESDKRMILYYQTHFATKDEQETLVPPAELVRNDAGVTDINLGAIHLNNLDDDQERDKPLTINDTVPQDPKLLPMWDELALIREEVDVHAFVGGDAPGTFIRLENEFRRYYPLLRDFVAQYRMSGVDLDIEREGKEMRDPTGTVRKVIDALREDFPEDFTISLAPGASELTQDEGGMSGVRYRELYRTHGAKITRFHAQFYCGWGDMSSKDNYLDVVDKSGIPAEKIVAGVVTHNKHCKDYIELSKLREIVRDLRWERPEFAGIFGWEYHLAGGSENDPKYEDAPWRWAKEISTALREA
ncbi:hypothetical protein SAMN04487905_11862 [Actinopolyspora xinjiangensis]|uniref:Uncharacterized protein n=2 Tax=Actinopolyspora xinjiangensis TaxID=405564 RepID=A0A1H0WYP4_9ACTN|nr:hypothetical protein SAMN04487905_11862 [Actinopolyspora xinjiangensis]